MLESISIAHDDLTYTDFRSGRQYRLLAYGSVSLREALRVHYRLSVPTDPLLPREGYPPRSLLSEDVGLGYLDDLRYRRKKYEEALAALRQIGEPTKPTEPQPLQQRASRPAPKLKDGWIRAKTACATYGIKRTTLQSWLDRPLKGKHEKVDGEVAIRISALEKHLRDRGRL